MKMLERLTFGRNMAFVAETAVATMPFAFTAASQSPPQFFGEVDTVKLSTLALILFVGSSIVGYILIRNVGESTYAPQLHKSRFLASSVVLMYLFCIAVVYLGYLIFVLPYNGSIIPGFRDLVAGIIIVSIYAVAMAGTFTVAVWSRDRRDEKRRAVQDFLYYTSLLSEADLDDAGDICDEIESAGETLENGTESEPMADTTELHATLQEWLNDFEKNSLSDQRRMVGWTKHEDLSREEPWKSHFSTFTKLRKELRVMNSSSNSKRQNGS